MNKHHGLVRPHSPSEPTGPGPFAWQKQQPGPAACSLAAEFSHSQQGKTHKVLHQRRLNSSMRESVRVYLVLSCPFVCHECRRFPLWSQNFQTFGSAPGSIHVLLSCFRCKLFPEMVLLRKSMTVMESEEEE